LKKPATATAARLFLAIFLLRSLLTRHFSLHSAPFSPPSGLAWAGVDQRRLPQRLFQELTAKSKFLAVIPSSGIRKQLFPEPTNADPVKQAADELGLDGVVLTKFDKLICTLRVKDK